MFLKAMFPFFFYFWEQKRLKKYQKKVKRIKTTRDFGENVFDFFYYMDVRHNTAMFRTPQKRTAFSLKKKRK